MGRKGRNTLVISLPMYFLKNKMEVIATDIIIRTKNIIQFNDNFIEEQARKLRRLMETEQKIRKECDYEIRNSINSEKP